MIVDPVYRGSAPIPVTRKPIFNLLAPRHELGHATKLTIYLSKALTGAVVWALLVFPLGTNLRALVTASLAVYVTTKVCYYVNTKQRPTRWWETLADWCCDGVLHMGWYGCWALFNGHERTAALMFGLWLATYPWSAE